jgi:hypothetical protein
VPIALALTTVILAALAGGCGIWPATAEPSPSGSAFGALVDQVDGQFGYEMLRPAAWSIVAGPGAGRTYRSPTTGTGRPLLLSANNLAVAPHPDPSEGIDLQWELFRQSGTLDGWTSRLQRSMDANGIQLTLLQALPSAKVYLWRGPDGTLALNAFAIDHGQPLFVALIGSVPAVSLGAPDQLRADGTLAAFTTIVTSIRAVPADPANVSPPLQ